VQLPIFHWNKCAGKNIEDYENLAEMTNSVGTSAIGTKTAIISDN